MKLLTPADPLTEQFQAGLPSRQRHRRVEELYAYGRQIDEIYCPFDLLRGLQCQVGDWQQHLPLIAFSVCVKTRMVHSDRSDPLGTPLLRLQLSVLITSQISQSVAHITFCF